MRAPEKCTHLIPSKHRSTARRDDCSHGQDETYRRRYSYNNGMPSGHSRTVSATTVFTPGLADQTGHTRQRKVMEQHQNTGHSGIPIDDRELPHFLRCLLSAILHPRKAKHTPVEGSYRVSKSARAPVAASRNVLLRFQYFCDTL
ncbi:Hypothetical predicted protein [Pelobates cultripes]|uniref:Uncharacterized protein n=1 Tax=Pelobates cultripes TaxID=61616 RepID=A0AAD1RV12_PELCU|nr:Hypothetical predicted protein [Pelobates cultripes]